MIDATSSQKLFTHFGYCTNSFARESARGFERLSRPMPKESVAYSIEVLNRIAISTSTLFFSLIAAPLFFPAFAFYTLAACAGQGRIELIQPVDPQPSSQPPSITVMSLNACLQDPWSPLTGGVVQPFEPFEPLGHHPTRIAAIVAAIATEDPHVFLGQEFDSLGAQDRCIDLLKEKGYSYFLRDLGSNDPLRNHSGLFVASKIPFQCVELISYPDEDRSGLAKWSNQGALTISVALQDGILHIINTHLKYGKGEKNQEARNRQLNRHIAPLLRQKNTVLVGDLNFSTALVPLDQLGLSGYFNAIENNVTCTDAGKHTLRGKSLTPDNRPCTDCKERIDGLIYNPKEIKLSDVIVKPLTVNGQLLSDHYATLATVSLQKMPPSTPSAKSL